jgi:hypothetical protein
VVRKRAEIGALRLGWFLLVLSICRYPIKRELFTIKDSLEMERSICSPKWWSRERGVALIVVVLIYDLRVFPIRIFDHGLQTNSLNSFIRCGLLGFRCVAYNRLRI